jgi:hypothetical protein
MSEKAPWPGSGTFSGSASGARKAGRKQDKSEAEIVRKWKECERAVVQQMRGGLPWS